MTKKTNEAVGVVAVIVGFAGYLAAFGTAPAALAERVGVSNRALVRASLSAIAVCATLIVWRALSSVNRWLQPPTQSPRPEPQIAVYETVAAKRSDLPVFREILTRQFGESEVASLDLTKRWYSRNPNIFQLLSKTNLATGAQKQGGGFRAVPLADSIIPEIELGGIRGSTIPEKYILSPRQEPTAWWFGDLVSTSKRTNAVLMKALRDFAIQNLRPYTRVYARPLTKEGLALMRGVGFVTVGDHCTPVIGRVCALYPEDVNDLLERSRKPSTHTKRVAKVESPEQRTAMALAAA